MYLRALHIVPVIVLPRHTRPDRRVFFVRFLLKNARTLAPGAPSSSVARFKLKRIRPGQPRRLLPPSVIRPTHGGTMFRRAYNVRGVPNGSNNRIVVQTRYGRFVPKIFVERLVLLSDGVPFVKANNNVIPFEHDDSGSNAARPTETWPFESRVIHTAVSFPTNGHRIRVSLSTGWSIHVGTRLQRRTKTETIVKIDPTHTRTKRSFLTS